MWSGKCLDLDEWNMSGYCLDICSFLVFVRMQTKSRCDCDRAGMGTDSLRRRKLFVIVFKSFKVSARTRYKKKRVVINSP